MVNCTISCRDLKKIKISAPRLQINTIPLEEISIAVIMTSPSLGIVNEIQDGQLI